MPVLSENLIAYYECDAASPTSDSWGSNTATLYSISSQTGQFNEAWGFSNSYDSVTLSGTPNVGTYSISGWVYNARHTGDAVFSSNGASFTSEWFHMYINGSGELGFLQHCLEPCCWGPKLPLRTCRASLEICLYTSSQTSCVTGRGSSRVSR